MNKILLIVGIVLVILIGIAVATSNSWCPGCNIYGSREAITKLAIIKNDASICNRVGWTDTTGGWPARKVNQCYLDVAIATKNVEVCKMYRDIPKYSHDLIFSDAQCYLGATLNPEIDYKLCENIAVGNYKQECYQGFAQKLKDTSLCNNIQDDTEKYKCHLSVEGANLNCNNVPVTLKSSCYDDLAVLKKDPTLCDKANFTDQNSKRYCYESILENTSDVNLLSKYCPIIKDGGGMTPSCYKFLNPV